MSDIDALFTPIPRTDEAGAKAFLIWLHNSRFKFHIDDAPEGVAFPFPVPPPVLDALQKRVEESFVALGYNQAWMIYGA